MKIPFSLYQHNGYMVSELKEVIDIPYVNNATHDEICTRIRQALYEYKLNLVYDTETEEVSVESVDL